MCEYWIELHKPIHPHIHAYIYIYIYIYIHMTRPNMHIYIFIYTYISRQYTDNKFAQATGAVEYTNYTTVEG